MKKSRITLWATIAVVIAGILFGIWWANTHIPKEVTSVPTQGVAKLGQTAPEFQAATTQGLFDLSKAAKPVFLEVFATWCPHCQRETSVIDQLYAHYKGRVDFVAVTGSTLGMDHNSPASELDTVNFIKAFDVKYPVAFDPSMNVAKAYLQGGYPTLVVIDRNKKITYLSSGETSYTELATAIDNALK
jgi:thiol-disulfide isomerase/thioredoxin